MLFRSNAEVGWNGAQRTVAISSDGSIGALKYTENFLDSALVHIFSGHVNVNGEATGYHYEGMKNAQGNIIQGTVTAPNQLGVYTGKVKVNGVDKESNSGYSTFYPKTWTMQQVVDAINEAYESKVFKVGNEYYGYDKNGMKIIMYLDKDTNKIISAFPVL